MTNIKIKIKYENFLDLKNVDLILKANYSDFERIYEIEFKNKKIIFKMTNLKYINSKSIGYIADVFSNIEENESQMYISNCTEWVKDILELVWITQIVPTVDDVSEAITAMS